MDELHLSADEAQRRVERYIHGGSDPRSLWGEITESGFAASLAELARLCRLLLPSSDSRATLAHPRDAAYDGPSFAAAAFASGLGPLLGHWHERGRLDVPNEFSELLRAHLQHGRLRAARLRTQLVSLLHRFRSRGIDAVILKGMHTGWEYFPEPGTRPCNDIDLLIPAAQLASAAGLLAADGFSVSGQLEDRATWTPADAGIVASVMFNHEDSPWAVDLHGTIDRDMSPGGARARFGLRHADDLRAWDVDGAPARVLAPPLLLCHLAVHCASHLPQLSMLRVAELVLVLRRDWTDEAVLIERLEREGTIGLAYGGLKLAEDLVPGTVPPLLLARARARSSAKVRRFVDALDPVGAHQLFNRSMADRLLWKSGPRALLSTVGAAIWPVVEGTRLPFREAFAPSRFRRLLRLLVAGTISWRRR